METLQEYRQRKAEEYLRANYQQIRREYWMRKEAARETPKCSIHYMRDYK